MGLIAGLPFKEIEEGGVDCFGRKNPKRFNYKWGELRDYWNNSPLSHLLNKSYLNDNHNDFDIGCMACGQNYDNKYNGRLDRAHILASSIQGSNHISNIHSLCKTCHGESEELYGLTYWMWLYNKAKVYTHGYFMTTEIEDGELYAYKAEFEIKLQEQATEIKNYFFLKGFSSPVHYTFYQLDEENKTHTLGFLARLHSGLTDDDIKHILEICEYATLLSKSKVVEIEELIEGLR